jgi:hypothetical protein
MSTYEEIRLKELESNPERRKKLLRDTERMIHENHILSQENKFLKSQINNRIGVHWSCSFEAEVITKFGKAPTFEIYDDTLDGTCEEQHYDWQSDLETLIYLAVEELVKGLVTGVYYFYIEVQSAWMESGWETIEYDCEPNITYLNTKRKEAEL